jgi:hypothetical protein
MASTPAAGIYECEQCQRLREVYWEALWEEARLECLSVGTEFAPEVVQNLAGQLEVAEQARKAALDALISHQIERGHS